MMKTKLSLTAILFVSVIVIISCKKYKLESDTATENYSSTPVLPEQPYNYSNSGNDNLATLGRVLFYDRNLSLNNSVSCSSCHQQSRAFCDNLQFSVGLDNGKTPRNSPSIFAKSGRMFWDGRANGIQDLVLKPVKNHVEMKFENLAALAKKIAGVEYYAPLFTKAFGSPGVDSTKIQLALAEFILNFNFSNNKFSRSLEKTEALTASEELGRSVFFGRGKCSKCHHLENEGFSPPMGSPSQGYGFTNVDFNIGLDKEYADNGAGAISGNSFDNGKFMVPVLLNVEYTSPYMHDGRFKTLEEVIEHYSTGIQNHPNLDFELRGIDFEKMTEAEMQKLDLNHDGDLDNTEISNIPPVRFNFSQVEKRALVDFLKTLSDPSILTEPKFNNPFLQK